MAPGTCKLERFLVILKGFQLLRIVTKRSRVVVPAVLDPPRIYHDYIPYNPCISLVIEP